MVACISFAFLLSNSNIKINHWRRQVIISLRLLLLFISSFILLSVFYNKLRQAAAAWHARTPTATVVVIELIRVHSWSYILIFYNWNGSIATRKVSEIGACFLWACCATESPQRNYKIMSYYRHHHRKAKILKWRGEENDFEFSQFKLSARAVFLELLLKFPGLQHTNLFFSCSCDLLVRMFHMCGGSSWWKGIPVIYSVMKLFLQRSS